MALIFTGKITNWDDPRITADSGRAFPSLPLKPVTRSDANASSLRLSEWIAQIKPGIWRRFCGRVALEPCEPTSSYPAFAGADAQVGPDDVAGEVANANGAIGFVLPGFAKQRGFPLASVQNRSGRFVQPVAGNVEAALRDATELPDGTPVLSRVYASRRPNAYPLSSYAFAIVPTTTAPPFTTDKGDTLGRFLAYDLCGGQTKAAELGYGSLPANLVRHTLTEIAAIPGASAYRAC